MTVTRITATRITAKVQLMEYQKAFLKALYSEEYAKALFPRKQSGYVKWEEIE